MDCSNIIHRSDLCNLFLDQFTVFQFRKCIHLFFHRTRLLWRWGSPMNKSTQIYIQHAHLYINQASDPPFISIVNIYISYECVAPCKSARLSMLKDTQWQASENIARKSCKWVGSGCTARLHNILPQHLHYYIYMKILSNNTLFILIIMLDFASFLFLNFVPLRPFYSIYFMVS